MRLDVLLALAALVAAGCDRGSRAEAPAGETRPEAVTITVASVATRPVERMGAPTAALVSGTVTLGAAVWLGLRLRRLRVPATATT